jgi:hypothetical protein
MDMTRRFGRRTGYACRLTIVSETNNKLAATSIVSALCTYVRTIIMLKKIHVRTQLAAAQVCTRSAPVHHPAGRPAVGKFNHRKKLNVPKGTTLISDNYCLFLVQKLKVATRFKKMFGGSKYISYKYSG